MTNLYNAIFHRKSVRKYNMEPLANDILAEIKEYVNHVEPLEKTIDVEFSYISTNEVKNILPIKAPHYLCVYSKRTGNYLTNVGFMLQQVDLYLSSKGIGSCWLGMAKPTNGVPTQLNGMEFVIMLAFGNSLDPVHRSDLSQFKRKDLVEVGTAKGVDELLNAVRLAPSASNSQPWFITGDTEKLQIYRIKLGMIKAALFDKMNKIDIGIGLCHLFLAAKVLGIDAQIIQDKQDQAIAPEGYEYMASVKL